MPRSSKSHALLSDAALGSLVSLGERLREARLRRNWTQVLAAEKSGLSESSIKKVETGSAHITIAAYLSLLDVFGLPTALDQLIKVGDDTLGEALSRTHQRSRASQPRNQDEWEI